MMLLGTAAIIQSVVIQNICLLAAIKTTTEIVCTDMLKQTVKDAKNGLLMVFSTKPAEKPIKKLNYQYKHLSSTQWVEYSM